MRLWSLHPCYLDAKGLVALWHEGLLAVKVLSGQTNAYCHHPQLIRFSKKPDPVRYLRSYLTGVFAEAQSRRYHFNRTKIEGPGTRGKIELTTGQIKYEWMHLLNKLKIRDPELYKKYYSINTPDAHPLFKLVEGPIADWERIKP